MSSLSAVIPKMSVPGSPGVSDMMAKTRKAAPMRTGMVKNRRLSTYLYIILLFHDRGTFVWF